jgi:glutamate--cysteine ligase
MNEENQTEQLHIGEIKKLFPSTREDYRPKIGIEVEKIGLYYENSKPPTYGGSRGYLAILGKMYEELGWEIISQQGKRISSMKRGNSYLHLESDGRIELAGSPHESIHDLAREMRIHQNEISEISKIFGIIWIGCGYHPFSRNVDILDIPDERKDKLLRYFLTKKEAGNDFSLAWFKKTSGIHINVDYLDENDFARKNKVILKISPILTAMFANSPFSKKKFTGYMSFRSHVAHANGLPQFDIPQSLYESEFSYNDWIEHVLDLPFVTLVRDDKWYMPNCTFREFMDKGYEGFTATMNDFELHIKTAWKDVKAKSVIELRFLDSLPPRLIPSAAAIVKGLLYDDDNLNALEKMTASWSHSDFMQLRNDVAKLGLQASIGNLSVLDISRDLIEMAEKSLKKDRIRNIENFDESIYLEPIKDFVLVKGKSPAEWLIENWYGKWRKSFHPVIQWMQY